MNNNNTVKGSNLFLRGDSVMIETRYWGWCQGAISFEEKSRCGTFAIYTADAIIGKNPDGSLMTRSVTESWYKFSSI